MIVPTMMMMMALRGRDFCFLVCLLGYLLAPNFGNAEEDVIPIESISLEELLTQTVRDGHLGSFGWGLEKYRLRPFLHAYSTFDWVKAQNKPNYFDLHYFNIFAGVNVDEMMIAEIQLEHEHGGAELDIRYAQVDFRVIDSIYIRSGKFLLPFGLYNEQYYPEYKLYTPRGPFVRGFREVVPVAWPEVGVQMRGRWPFSKERSLEAVMYVVNGLEQFDDPLTPEVEEGGDIRSMRGNVTNSMKGNKAVGGRLNVRPGKGFAIGLSAYSGAYTADGSRQLSLFGSHLYYDIVRLSLRVEGAYGIQQIHEGDLRKLAILGSAGYKVKAWMMPALGIDVMRLGGNPEADRVGVMGVVNFFPYYDSIPTLIARLAGIHYESLNGELDEDQVMLQLTVGF